MWVLFEVEEGGGKGEEEEGSEAEPTALCTLSLPLLRAPGAACPQQLCPFPREDNLLTPGQVGHLSLPASHRGRPRARVQLLPPAPSGSYYITGGGLTGRGRDPRSMARVAPQRPASGA